MRLRPRRVLRLKGETIFEFPRVGNLGIAYAEIRESRLHLHRRTTEVYIVQDGRGKVVLGERVMNVSKGDVVKIPPNTPHKVLGDVKIFVISLPAWRKEDHIPLE